MAEQKKKIVIVDYRQFQIIRSLLRPDYEILPDIKTDKEFRELRAKLVRFLTTEDQNYFIALGDYKDINAFIVDYELKHESDKTGILFCKSAECICNGSIPVLFLTIIPDAVIENQINTIEDEIPNIICKNLRKPEFWGNEEDTVESIVLKSQTDIIKSKILSTLDKLIKDSAQKNQSVHEATE